MFPASEFSLIYLAFDYSGYHGKNSTYELMFFKTAHTTTSSVQEDFESYNDSSAICALSIATSGVIYNELNLVVFIIQTLFI